MNYVASFFLPQPNGFFCFSLRQLSKSAQRKERREALLEQKKKVHHYFFFFFISWGSIFYSFPAQINSHTFLPSTFLLQQRARIDPTTIKATVDEIATKAYSSVPYFFEIVNLVWKSHRRAQLVRNSGFGYLLELVDCPVPRGLCSGLLIMWTHKQKQLF